VPLARKVAQGRLSASIALSKRRVASCLLKILHIDLGAIFAHNRPSDRRNTVQQLAVNLAYAEPCHDEGTALFVCAGLEVVLFGQNDEIPQIFEFKSAQST
jgi:hypothetical protein